MRADGRYQIGYVADRVGLSLRTVRYYEEVGLVEPSGRTEGGFRLYTDDDIARLERIKRLKPLNFTLEELGDLMTLWDRLDLGDVDAVERDKLSQRLATYLQVADQRCDKLRAQLAAVEKVTEELRRQVSPGSRPGSSVARS